MVTVCTTKSFLPCAELSVPYTFIARSNAGVIKEAVRLVGGGRRVGWVGGVTSYRFKVSHNDEDDDDDGIVIRGSMIYLEECRTKSSHVK
jgi:hypothetical protein